MVTPSPRFPQSNGFAEQNVQTIKSLLKKAKEAGNDEYLALLEFRNIPISGLSKSPAQLLMGRNLRSSLPMLPWTLEPSLQMLHKSRTSWLSGRLGKSTIMIRVQSLYHH